VSAYPVLQVMNNAHSAFQQVSRENASTRVHQQSQVGTSPVHTAAISVDFNAQMSKRCDPAHAKLPVPVETTYVIK